MVLDNSRYPVQFEFLILCCVLFSLLLVARMGILLGPSAGLLGGFGLEIRAGTPGWAVSPRSWQGEAQHSWVCFKVWQVFLGSSHCFALQAGVKM